MPKYVSSPRLSDSHTIEFYVTQWLVTNGQKSHSAVKTTVNLTFQKLYIELNITIKLEIEVLAADVRRKAASAIVPREIESINILSHVGYATKNRENRKAFFKMRSYYNCRSASQLYIQSSHFINYSNAAARKV